MKSTIIAAAAGALALGACTQTGGADSGGQAADAFYQCGPDLLLKVNNLDGERVAVRAGDDDPLILSAQAAASGARYATMTHEFWDKGGEATWTVGRMTPLTCQRVALPRGL